MFVGWIRKDSFKSDLDELEKSCVIDKNLLQNSAFYNQRLCFGAYEENRLEAVISAFNFDKSIYINNFYYKQNVSEEVKKRLVKLLLRNIEFGDKSIYLLVKEDEKEIFSSLGFESFAKFRQVIYSSSGAVFNFNKAMAKSISNENYANIIKQIDKACFNDDRFGYVTKSVFKTSSLLLSTQSGFQHSYALNKSIIKLSPWIMRDMSYDDSEKMMRGVIYHRGLKKILAFIPEEVEEITNLYKTYKFDFLEQYELMYLNKKPNLNIEMIYGF
jgi:hypothetical protein